MWKEFGPAQVLYLPNNWRNTRTSDKFEQGFYKSNGAAGVTLDLKSPEILIAIALFRISR